MKLFIISILIAALSFFFLIKPYWEEKISLTNELIELNEVLSKKIALQNKLSDLILRYNEAKQYEKNINLAVPNSPEEENLIAQIDAIAANSAVVLKSLNIAKKETDKDKSNGIKEVNLEIKIEGNLSGIEKFLELIGNSLRILEVSSMNISYGENGLFDVSIISKSFFE